MFYQTELDSPLGKLTAISDGEALLGLWFVGQKFDRRCFETCEELVEKVELNVFEHTQKWLTAYFAGDMSVAMPLLRPQGTAFQQEVWQLLRTIPAGKTVTYGELAQQIAKHRGQKHFSAQAIGGSVGRNPISLLIPCHRVLGSDGSLTGYAGGVERKQALLQSEGVNIQIS